MDIIVAFVIAILLYLIAGMACVEAWKDEFDDIETRYLRVSGRIIMMVLWPVWLVLGMLCAIIGLFILCLIEIFK